MPRPFWSLRATHNCAIQFNPDQNHLWKWIGILIRIGSGLGECAFSVDVLKADLIWFNVHWVSSVDRPLALLNWWNTPQKRWEQASTTFFGRRCKTRLPLVKKLLEPRYSKEEDLHALCPQKEQQKFYCDHHTKPLQMERQLECYCLEKQPGVLGLAPDKLEHRVMTWKWMGNTIGEIAVTSYKQVKQNYLTHLMIPPLPKTGQTRSLWRQSRHPKQKQVTHQLDDQIGCEKSLLDVGLCTIIRTVRCHCRWISEQTLGTVIFLLFFLC